MSLATDSTITSMYLRPHMHTQVVTLWDKPPHACELPVETKKRFFGNFGMANIQRQKEKLNNYSRIKHLVLVMSVYYLGTSVPMRATTDVSVS